MSKEELEELIRKHPVLQYNIKIMNELRHQTAKDYIFNLMLEFRFFRHEAYDMGFDLDEFWSGTCYEILKEWLK